MANKAVRRVCIYCGHKVGRVKKGEHIVPSAIGGAVTIKTVCGECNNAFSQIDAELCSRSPLSVVASQEIDAHLWQIWDVDHAAGNLLLDAKPDWAAQSLALYPQVVFERSGPQLRGDHEEILRFGRDNFERVFFRSMLRAFRRHEAGRKRWLHFERIEDDSALERQYRLPPRIISRRPIRELADRLVANKQALLILRHQTEADRRFALNALDSWNESGGVKRFEIGIGSALPAVRCFYQPDKVLRCLTKVAVNLLAYYCPNTAIGQQCLRDVIQMIKGRVPVKPSLLFSNGFVQPSDIKPIIAPGNAHSFRLLHMDGHWHVYSSYFGGRIGSFVRFPGPNGESWSCADVVAPLHSKSWAVRTGKLLQPLTIRRAEWHDLSAIIPSVEMLNVETEILVKRVVVGA